ncbi:hypothetical protein ACJX0J_015489, partial [Zea mays]
QVVLIPEELLWVEAHVLNLKPSILSYLGYNGASEGKHLIMILENIQSEMHNEVHEQLDEKELEMKLKKDQKVSIKFYLALLSNYEISCFVIVQKRKKRKNISFSPIIFQYIIFPASDLMLTSRIKGKTVLYI